MPPKKTHKPVKPQSSHPPALSKLLLFAGVVFLAILILVTKQQIANAPAEAAMDAAVDAAVDAPVTASVRAPVTTDLPEVQLMRALDAGQPTLAFFHSLTCASCKQMTAIVQEVYPEFAGSITLVDIDVYDERNAGLLQSAGIRAIPTVIFFDRSGAGKQHIGVVEAQDLRQILAALSGGS